MYIGVAYYPEHWPRERWPVDARLMREAGINVVRLAEFAWSRLEPREGVFDFAWLDEAIGILAAEDIRVILGTPSEAMPPWLARTYPDALAVDKHGQRIPYGARRDSCLTDSTYRWLSVRMAEMMARHYAEHPAVIGWQIDNELGGPFCYCASCQIAWHTWLAERFGTVAELNRRWGTIFWSHEYTHFDEVPLPRREGGNPSLELEYRRFHSRNVVNFLHAQQVVLRRCCPAHFITHNLCGFFLDDTNYYELAKELDFVGLDFYYNNSPWDNRFRVASYEAAAMDLMRSVKRRNFWVTETPVGTIGTAYMLRNLRPLELRRMNFQALAHGADGLLWFRWRTCRTGVEQFTHGLLGHDGVPGRRYADAARVAAEFHRLAPEIEGSTTRADAAMIYSYDNRWAFGIQPNAKGFDYFDELLQYHRALKREGVNVDFIAPETDMTGYRLIVLPAGYLVTPEFAQRLEAFARAGGVVVITPRSGVKDADNVATELPLPGLLRAMAGIRIDEYEALLESSPVRFADEWGGGTHAAQHFAEWIVPETAFAVARYAEPYLADFAALTEHPCGAGTVYYAGTCFTADDPVRLLITRALDVAGIAHPLALPAGVGTATRERGDTRYLFLLNHNDEPVTVELSELPPCTDLLSGHPAAPALMLPGGDVAVLKYTVG